MNDNLVQLPNILPEELAVRIIDSDKERLGRTHAMVKTMLPEGVEVTSALHTEEVRRQLELLARRQAELESCPDRSKAPEQDRALIYQPRKYTIFLPRTTFTNFNQLFGSQRSESFDDEKSVRDSENHVGVFKMLRIYWNFLTQAGGKFFNAFYIDSDDANPKMYCDYDENIHLANYPYPTEKVNSKQITQIQLMNSNEADSPEEIFSRGQLAKMFTYFDQLVGLGT